MIPILIGLIFITLTIMVQSTIASQIPLLEGTVDLVMLVVVSWVMQPNVKSGWQWSIIAGVLLGLVSAIPFWVPVAGYLAITSMGFAIKRRVWQIPILAFFLMVFAGTFILHTLSFTALSIVGVPLNIQETFNQITLPTILLNLIVAIPVNGVVSEISRWVHPEEEEI